MGNELSSLSFTLSPQMGFEELDLPISIATKTTMNVPQKAAVRIDAAATMRRPSCHLRAAFFTNSVHSCE